MGGTDRTRERLSRASAVADLVLALLSLGGGYWLYAHQTRGTPTSDVLNLELKGPSAGTQVPASVIWWDFALIAGYGVALGLGAWLATRLMRSASGRSWAEFGLFTVGVAVVADVVEDAFLLAGLSGHPNTNGWPHTYEVAAVAAVIKFCALLPAAVVALAGIFLTLARLFRGCPQVLSSADVHPAAPVLPDDSVDSGHPSGSTIGVTPVVHSRWLRGYETPACGQLLPVAEDVTGVCLSGGGIRAASVAMGVLQSPSWRTDVLPRARFLVSVSGGGYTAGAFQLALTEASSKQAFLDGEEPIRDARTAFCPGSAEEDHVRRHASYLASTPVELVLALGLVLRHLLLTLIVLFGPAVLLGVLVGLYYKTVRLSPIDGSTSSFPVPPVSARWAVGTVIVVALGCWLATQLAHAHTVDMRANTFGRRLGRSSVKFAYLSAVVVLVVVAVPALMWISTKTLAKHTAVQVGGPIGGVVLAYGASLASLAWRHRTLVTDKGTGQKALKAAPRGFVQLALVVLALAVLAAGWLLLFGGVASKTLQLAHLTPTLTITLVVLLAVVFFLGVLSDETTLSLHPFYRRRLATAFAVRRVHQDGRTTARAYAPEERTTLSTYGQLPAQTAFPHVIFAASATLGGKRTAPGNHRVSYTFCSHWVGGPDVGYVRTHRLEELAPARLERDLTVQAAVALSGAAIAASIGSQRTAWYETLFVVSGIRLGAWMPNPAFMIATYAATRHWHDPGLPHARRMTYLLRELFGLHSPTAALLQVTDGGFYDNLGLVELFRRGCTRIYCVDASGDDPPAAATLAEALTLAFEELGVRTDLEKGTWSTFTAGSAQAMLPKDPLAALSARLSQTGIITGTFEYPPESPFAGRTGALVVAKASLWPNLPYQVLAHAQSAEVFPRDSTGDQFFDDAQYTAYTALGRELGTTAVEAMKASVAKLEDTQAAPPGGAGGLVATIGAWLPSWLGGAG